MLKKFLSGKYLNLSLFLLLLQIPNSSRAQDFPLRFNYLTVDDGLSHTDANDLKQDKLGFIWIATYFGLDRYDGYTIKKFYNYNVPKKNALKNRISSLSPDNDGNIWLATEDGIQCFDSKTEKYIDFNTPDSGEPDKVFSKIFSLKNGTLATLKHGRVNIYLVKKNWLQPALTNLPEGMFVYDIASDSLGNLWLTSSKGIFKLNWQRQLSRLIMPSLIENVTFSQIGIDRWDNILVSNEKKLYKIKWDGSKIADSSKIYDGTIIGQFDLPAGITINDITQDFRNNYWATTGSGLLYLDSHLQLISKITTESFLNSINTNSLTRLIIDKSQCLMIGSFGGGVNYCDLNEKLFHTLQHNPESENSLSGNHIKAILEDNQYLWIGTNANGLNLYSFEKQYFLHFNADNGAVKIKSNNIQSLAFDDFHNLWIGTNKGIDILDPTLKKLLKPDGYDHFPVGDIESLTKDCYGNMWFGSHTDGIACIWHDKQNNYHVKYHDGGYFIWANPKKPELLVSSIEGLKRLSIDSTGNIIKSYHYGADASANSLSSDYTFPICRQSEDTFWIGTIGGGLNRLVLNKDNSYHIKVYGKKYGIFEDVESMEIDNAGNIWMGGNGLLCFNPVSGKLTRYDKNDGLQGNSFKVGAAFKGKDGRLYFGGINGLNYFYPDSIKSNTVPAAPVFTDLFINNKSVKTDSSNSRSPVLGHTIEYSKHLALTYQQNNFVITFSAMDFANPAKCLYRYKLIGFDKDWNYTDGANPRAAYSNLDYGDYTFVLEAANNDGIWSPDQAKISITMMPPWWKSNLAKIIYGLLFLSILAGIYIYQARLHRLKRAIAVRDVEEAKQWEMHQQKEELYQQQLQFFTNVSHELRTPLTLILGPLEKLMKLDKTEATNHFYQVMNRNVNRLMNLVNELMNFRKVAESVIPLQVELVDLKDFLQKTYEEFIELAQSKNIDFDLIENDTAIPFWLDRQILEKMLFNLLNNSIKYTEAGGNVKLEAFVNWEKYQPAYGNEYQIMNDYRGQKYVYFKISDTGVGISKDSIKNIFDRYYRVDNNHLGSGVGLALVKSLVVLHKGDIHVFSERLRGTEIIIGLPCGENDYNLSEKLSLNSKPDTPRLEKIKQEIAGIPDQSNYNNEQLPEGKKSILIVEDNHELRAYLKDLLLADYLVYEAGDGKAGLEMAVLKPPDLIISDVMMPLMNGIEFCSQLKEKLETSHIPFIILSAKDALDSKIHGMESGADYYFAKPISTDLLLLTIQNLFIQRQHIKDKYLKDYYANANELVHSEKDKQFMDTLLGIIEDNILEPELDVNFLCQSLFISRTNLYQKLKSVSDQSVGEFIRTTRLKKAAHIMTHEDIAMTDLIDRIGFQSISYFSRAFKKEYGKSPSQFLKDLDILKEPGNKI